MISKFLSVPAGMICIVGAALRQDGPDPMPAAAWVAGILAALGVVHVLCGGFLGGFTRNAGGSRIADSPQLIGDGIFEFVGWVLLTVSAGIVAWLHWGTH